MASETTFIYDPTNRSVRGTASPFATIAIKVDGAQVATLQANALGTYAGLLPVFPNGGQVITATPDSTIGVTLPGGIGLPLTASWITTLCAIGDSITNLVAASTPDKAWLNKIAAYLSATPTNLGVNGTPLQNSNDATGNPMTNNMRDRYAAQMTGANKKELAIIAGGAADARYTGAPATFNVANYINDYREMLYGLINDGYPINRILLVTLYWWPDAGFAVGSTPAFTGQTRAGFEAYVKAVRDLAKEFGCYVAETYLPMAQAAGNGALITDADNIHPNDFGHDIIFKAVRDAKLQVQNAYVYDSFTAANGTALTARDGAIGAKWTLSFGSLTGLQAPQIQSNRLYNTATGLAFGALGQPASADYEVIGTLRCLSVIAGENIGIYGRGLILNADTRYWARYLQGTGWALFKTVNGTSTQLGATSSSSPLTAGVSRRLMLRMIGSTISLWVDGVQLVSVTDTDITAPNNAGLRLASGKTATTGIHVEDFLARPVVPFAA